ncbi:MAG: hypothetical protein ACRD7E_04370, partial [Bryobacteraceae bacterium]
RTPAHPTEQTLISDFDLLQTCSMIWRVDRQRPGISPLSAMNDSSELPMINPRSILWVRQTGTPAESWPIGQAGGYHPARYGDRYGSSRSRHAGQYARNSRKPAAAIVAAVAG